MRLGIISDCIHYKTADGKVGTENHILLRQLQTLCSYFTETLICCPFTQFDSTKVISTYTNPNISFTAVPLVGGDTLKDKLKLASTIPAWLKAFKQVDNFSEIVYQRFPNNLNIPGFLFFYLKQKKVFGTYTGTWSNYESEPATYRFQKWFLKNLFKGPVWVYNNGQQVDKRIHNGFSPSYSQQDWNEEFEQVENRIQQIEREGLDVIRMITVGSLINYKNQLTILKACVTLKKQAIAFHLTIVGDGPMRRELEQFVVENDLSTKVTMAGKKTSGELRILYRRNDFVVQAPLFEGFGKVPVEGFFHGVIPVINNISMASSITGNGTRGFLFDAADPKKLASVLADLKNKIALLPQMIRQGRAFAQTQTLEAWASDYYNTVTKYFEQE